LYLIYTISDRAGSIPANTGADGGRMERMEASFNLMTQNLEGIQATMLSINGYMENIGIDIRKLHEINQPLNSIDARMNRLNESISNMESGISSLDRNTGELSSTMNTVANQLGQMTHDVNKMTKPRMMFPFD
jgi:methyl-accepting chemotaxis protein